MENLFGDGTVLKKRLQSSYSAAKPDSHCRVYFDYRIQSLNQNLGSPVLYDGLAQEIRLSPKNNDDLSRLEESSCEKCFLDTYSISRGFR